MNSDEIIEKVTIDDMMDFLDIEEHTRQTPEVKETVEKFMSAFLPTLIEDCPEFITFVNERYENKSL